MKMFNNNKLNKKMILIKFKQINNKIKKLKHKSNINKKNIKFNLIKKQ